MDKREIIYIALSNLISNSLEALEGMKKLPPTKENIEEITMLEYIISEALPLEEEYRKLLKGDSVTIQRPNWEELKASK